MSQVKSYLRAVGPVALVLLACVSIIIWQSNKGFGLTDDGFYLNWTMWSQHYKYSISEFGYVFHPLYSLVSGDIPSFRLIVVMVQVLAGLMFALGFLRFCGASSKATKVAAALGLITATFWVSLYGQITPTYNTLNLIGILLVLSGLLYATSEPATPEEKFPGVIVPALTVAVGLCLTALAKPTTAVATVLLASVWTALFRPYAWRALVLTTAGFTLFLFISAVFLIDGSIPAYIQRKFNAVAILINFATGHDAGGIVHSVIGTFIQDNTGKEWKFLQFGLAALFVLFLAFWWSRLLVRKSAWMPLVALGIPMLMGVLTAWLHATAAPATGLGWPAWAFRALQAAHFVIPIAIAGFCLGAWRELSASDRKLRKRVLMAAGLMFAAPFAYAFGTNSVVVIAASLASVFWAATLLLLIQLVPAARRHALTASASFLCAVVTLGMLAGGTAQPFQLYTPLWRQTEPVRLPHSGTTLLVDDHTAHYVRAFQNGATAHGFMPGMPVIDASGNAPGAILSIGGVSVGTPILIPVRAERSAYHMNAGQQEVDEANAIFISGVLRRADVADLKRSWILSRSLGENLPMQRALRELGLDFPGKYALVADASFHPDIPLGVHHYLWKPIEGAN